MAVAAVEEKLLGRLAKLTGSTDASLSSSFYQVLGLSILLNRRLIKAGRIRKLDPTRDNKSLQLYHHIIWLAREGLWITEYCILPFCQNGEQGPECRVMAAKLRASFYHVFCLYHNEPAITLLSARSPQSGSSPSTILTPKANNGQTRTTTSRSPKERTESKNGGRRSGKAVLRDPIPSMVSDASYVTNPYSSAQTQTPPPNYPVPPIPPDARRTPTRPPGLTPINVSQSQTAASFILPSKDFVPITQDYFERAQHLANSLLAPTHALRLSLCLEHAGFLYECIKEPDRARRLARRTIKEVYASSEGLDDEEFADAAGLVSALGGIVRRGTVDSSATTSRPSQDPLATPTQSQRNTRSAPLIDRTIAVSPSSNKRSRTGSPSQVRSITRTPERLSTVPEVESIDARDRQTDISPPVSRLSSRSRNLRGSSTASEKSSSKRRAMDSSADEPYGRSSPSSRSNVSERGARKTAAASVEPAARDAKESPKYTTRKYDPRDHRASEKRDAILRALAIVASVSKGISGSRSHRHAARML